MNATFMQSSMRFTSFITARTSGHRQVLGDRPAVVIRVSLNFRM
jgi:hypothetical protein